jgi:ATP-dependent Clp protease adapter protein ClpS
VGVGDRPPEDDQPDSEDLYEVRIMDNDHNTYGEVMQITMQALDISEEKAFAIAWEVDHMGSCVVAQGPYEAAEAIAQVIRTIGIEVQVNPIEPSNA